METIDRRGLKHYFLRKHQRQVQKFYKKLQDTAWQSEHALRCKERFEKNRDKLFTFLIETKTGYENHTPTLWQYTKVLEWFNKASGEGKQHRQWIIFLICQFKNKPALIFTNYYVDLDKISPVAIIPNQINGDINWVYTYIFKDLIKLNFLDLFGKEIEYR